MPNPIESSSTSLHRSSMSSAPDEASESASSEQSKASSLMCEHPPLSAGSQELVQSASLDNQLASSVEQMLSRQTATSPRDAASEQTAASDGGLTPFLAVDADEQGNYSVQAAAAKGELAGGELELGSVQVLSTQEQSKVSASVAHWTSAGNGVQVDLGLLEAEAHAGTENKDGSRGANAGVSATLVSAEETISADGNSFTLGANIGVGVEASSGMRDSDGDGHSEYCARIGAGPQLIPVGGVIGGCVEPGGILERLRGD